MNKKKVETITIGGNSYIVLYQWKRAGQNMIARTNSNEGTIYDAYKRPSSNKVWAWRDGATICYNMGGTNLRVTGHNCNEFTLAFEATYDGVPVRIVRTHLHDYIIFKN